LERAGKRSTEEGKNGHAREDLGRFQGSVYVYVTKIATDAPLRSSFHMSVWDAYVASIVKAGIKKLPRYYHYNIDIDI